MFQIIENIFELVAIGKTIHEYNSNWVQAEMQMLNMDFSTLGRMFHAVWCLKFDVGCRKAEGLKNLTIPSHFAYFPRQE